MFNLTRTFDVSYNQLTGTIPAGLSAFGGFNSALVSRSYMLDIDAYHDTARLGMRMMTLRDVYAHSLKIACSRLQHSTAYLHDKFACE